MSDSCQVTSRIKTMRFALCRCWDLRFAGFRWLFWSCLAIISFCYYFVINFCVVILEFVYINRHRFWGNYLICSRWAQGLFIRIASHRLGLDLFFTRSYWISPLEFCKGLEPSELIKVVLKDCCLRRGFGFCRSCWSLRIGFRFAEFFRMVLDNFRGNFTKVIFGLCFLERR